MSKLKVAVIYYSATGANHQLSQWSAKAAEGEDTEVRRLLIPETAPKEAIESNEAWKDFHENVRPNETEVTLDDLDWADVLIFNIPTRYGNMSSQVQSFFDTTGGLWFNGQLVNKVVSATASAQNPHGGQESTIQSLYKTMMHWGSIIVSPAYTDSSIFAAGGNPYGTSATIGQDGKIQNADKIEAALTHQVKRTIDIAKKIHS